MLPTIKPKALTRQRGLWGAYDKGVMDDGEGREIDFKNTIILMTSNAASDKMMAMCSDPETCPEPDVLATAIAPELRKGVQAGAGRAHSGGALLNLRNAPRLQALVR